MKASEICIGDWFKAIDYNSPFRITAIYDDVVQTQADYQSEIDGNWYSEAEIKDLVPIPLTEEILVKNGFVFNKGYAVLQVSEDTYLDFYKHEHRLRKVWEGIDEWNNHAKVRDVTFVCQCYYVHEFQHALRLAGVQKEIEL